MAINFCNSGFFLRTWGTGARILVPSGFPSSLIRTRLLLSNLGVRLSCLWTHPMMIPFFFCPLIATITLSPSSPHGCPLPPFLYTWITFGAFPSNIACFPRFELSTTLILVIFCTWFRAGVVVIERQHSTQETVLDTITGKRFLGNIPIIDGVNWIIFPS